MLFSATLYNCRPVLLLCYKSCTDYYCALRVHCCTECCTVAYALPVSRVERLADYHISIFQQLSWRLQELLVYFTGFYGTLVHRARAQ